MASTSKLTVYAPISGALLDISKVPDPAFAEKMLGDGVAISPEDNFVYAPFDGRIKTLHKYMHAFVFENNGFEILIHIGIDSVALQGRGFKTFVKEGQSVKKGDKIIEFDRNFLAQNAPSNLVIILLATPVESKIDKAKKEEVNVGDILFEASADVKPCVDTLSNIPCGEEFSSPEISICNKTGLHARPASVIADIAQSYKDTAIWLESKSHKADAKSMVEILGLSLIFGSKVKVLAQGAHAEEAVNKVMEAIESGLKDTVIKETPATAPVARKQVVDLSKEAQIKAIPIFPSFCIGKSYILKETQADISTYRVLSPEEENLKFEEAIKRVKETLKSERHSAYGQKDREDILLAHLAIMDDPFLMKETHQLILRGKTAVEAISSAIASGIEILKKADSDILRARIADFKDLKERIIAEITGSKLVIPDFKEDTILILQELYPYQLSSLNAHVVGVIMTGSSPLSHISIMLKNMGIGSVVCAGENILSLKQGSYIILDSKQGLITINPSNIEALKEQANIVKNKKIQNLSNAFDDATTKDGVEISVSGNVGSISQAKDSAQNGGEGIGLVRTEFLFSSARTAPTEEEQYKIYQEMVDLQKGNSVIIRTLDAGADKPMAFIHQEKEENPLLGRRGIRSSFENLDIFKTQVRAIMRVKPYGKAKIMLPMVTFVEEFLTAKRIIVEEQKKLGIDKVSVGMMVEVPSAALMADQFAKHADFFSLGTNDLTQYTIALDRAHPTLNFLTDTLNPSVLRLIKMTQDAGQAHNIAVGVCGAVASEVAGAILLLGFGIRNLSVVPGLIPDIKALIRTISIKDCEVVAKRALNLPSVEDVKNLVKKEFNI